MKFLFLSVIVIIASCHGLALETGDNGKNLEFDHPLNTLNSLAVMEASSDHEYRVTSEEQRRCIEFEKVRTWEKEELLIKCQSHRMEKRKNLEESLFSQRFIWQSDKIRKRKLRNGRSITLTPLMNLCPRGMRYNARRERCVFRFFG